jgi:large subunit ribosomal protein L3e
MVGYIDTPRGLRAMSTVWAQNLPTGVLRRFYKNWYAAKKHAFQNYAKRYTDEAGPKKSVKRDIERIRKYCSTVRVLCAT